MSFTSPKFQVYKDRSGKTRFRIRANNRKIVAVGEAYEKYASCLKGIESVRRNCNAPTEDLTVEGTPKLPNPKYQVFKDAKGEFRFHLKAANGEIIAKSEGYESREACLNGINVVRDCANAGIEDPFAVKKQTTKVPIEGKTLEVPKPHPLVTIKESALAEVKAEPEMAILPLGKEAIVQPPSEKLETTPETQMQKAPEPAAGTEDLTKVAPITDQEKETFLEAGPIETMLELHSASENITRGAEIAFQGRLFAKNTGKGIPNAKIRIYERDRSILGDDYLAFGDTGQDGAFSIGWKARNLTWRKKTGNVYAKFSGNEKAKSSQSSIQEITIR